VNEGGVIQNGIPGKYVARIPFDEEYEYFIDGNIYQQNIGGMFDSDGNFLGSLYNYQFNPFNKRLAPIGTKWLYVTCPNPWYRIPRREKYTKIHNYIKKPFDFNGKSAVFFGDSITAGYISRPDGPQYHDPSKSWAKLLCDKLGMTCTNKAIGGSSLHYAGTNDSGVIIIAGEQGVRYDVSEDFIFIAHGSNDWTSNTPIGNVDDMPQSATDATTFYGALNFVANYIKTNYPNKEVFFVLPIWRVRYDDFSNKLGQYRQAICDVALRNNFSVINGEEFGFDCAQYELINDLTHPTILGYQVYAQQVYDLIR
jgi:lysophospholipase L1-like esterase